MSCLLGAKQRRCEDAASPGNHSTRPIPASGESVKDKHVYVASYLLTDVCTKFTAVNFFKKRKKRKKEKKMPGTDFVLRSSFDVQHLVAAIGFQELMQENSLYDPAFNRASPGTFQNNLSTAPGRRINA